MAKLRGEFFGLHLDARREGDQLVSVASFRMDGRRREYQVEVWLPVGGSWFRDVLQVDLPETWGDTATRARFVEELTWFVRAAAEPGTAGLGVVDVAERTIKIRVPFEVETFDKPTHNKALPDLGTGKAPTR